MIKQLDEIADVPRLTAEVTGNTGAWTLNTGRQDRIQCQRDTQSIFLRSPPKPIPEGLTSNDVHASRSTKVSEQFPEVMSWVMDFVQRIRGTIGRVMLVRIKPQGRVYEHRDTGDYYAVRNRFHLILTAGPGSTLTCNGESVALKDGQLLWFDNRLPYSESNPGDEWSVRLIIDVLPPVRPPLESCPHRHFALMKPEVYLAEMRREIADQPELWNISKSRQTNIKVQRETSNIHLRHARKPIPDGMSGNDWHPSKKTPAADRCPAIYHFVESFAHERNAALSRLTVVRLNPNGRVYPHIDEGEYYLVRDRYHLVLQSPSGSEMICGDEKVFFQEGELWWFDNKAPHEAFNNSSEGRIHVIFDLLPSKPHPPEW